MSFEMVRAHRMTLAQLATELAIALIVIAILLGGIAAGIFFNVPTSGNMSGVAGPTGGNFTWSFDTLSLSIWSYLFPLSLAGILVAIVYHMYRHSGE